MNHETPTLVASKRERLGTRYAQRLRKTGQLPAVIYGHGADPISVSVDGKKTLAHLHHGQHVFNLEIEGEGTETCLVKDLQFGFLGDNVIHLDLTRVNLDERVKILVHLDLHGELKTANDPGAIVMHDYAEIEVECAVRDIPESIRVDLEEYESSINVGELKLPEGMVAITPADTNIIHVQIAAEEPEELADETPSEAPSDPSSDADAPKSED
ncbi:MAG: 50S ribosomal protein L25 [Phycisphaerales bacterium]|nr:50S ribosomal protein L25 [Phycisphaerales bacterium]